MPPATGSPAAADPLVPDQALTQRFVDGLKAIWPAFIRHETARLGLAVSGGPDSCALLLLGAAALPGRVEAATVDHGLRPDNAAEAQAVAGLCKRLNVPHRTLRVSVAPGNVQSAARAARYKALSGWIVERELGALATAHHADDQAETLLMRLNRASGVAGLAGARARGAVPGTDIAVLRPVLDWRREELAQIVAAAGVEAANDPSNRDDRFDRARLRKAISGADWLDVSAIARSASHLADADAALDWAARREWDECVHKGLQGLVYKPAAPRAVALRVITRIVEELDGEAPRGAGVARVYEALLARQPGSIGNLVARPDQDGWSFMRAPKRRS